MLSYTTIPATCTENAKKVGACSRCWKEISEEIAGTKLAHTPETIAAVPATCAKTGLTEGKKCSACGEIITSQAVIDMLPHTKEVFPGQPATYEDYGLTDGKKCSVCQEVLLAQQKIPRKTPPGQEGQDFWHDQYGLAWICTYHDISYTPQSNGSHLIVYTHHCVNDLNANTRTFTTQEGEACTKSNPIKTVDATCVREGYSLYECIRCHQEIKADITPRNDNHDPVEDPAITPSCTQEGRTAGQHCQREGCKWRIAGEVIPKLAHSEVIYPAASATCTKPGRTAGSHCQLCGKELTASRTIRALGHWYGQWSPKAAIAHEAICQRSRCGHAETVLCTWYTAAVNGTDVKVCPICGAFDQNVFQPLADAKAENVDAHAIPKGELIVRGLEAPFGTEPVIIDGLAGSAAPVYGLTVAYERAGKPEMLGGRVKFTVPTALSGQFALIRLDTAADGSASWMEIPAAILDGVLTFGTGREGLFLLMPAE